MNISTSEFFIAGNNTFFICAPNSDGFITIYDAVIRTEAQMLQTVTTYSNPHFNAVAGITIFVPEWVGGVVESLNALRLTVGSAASAAIGQYSPGVFTDVFGVCAPGTFGFTTIQFLEGFGLPGAPILFAYDNPQGANANRFLTPTALENGYRVGYVSNPLVKVVPDLGSTLLLFATAIVLLFTYGRQKV